MFATTANESNEYRNPLRESDVRQEMNADFTEREEQAHSGPILTKLLIQTQINNYWASFCWNYQDPG